MVQADIIEVIEDNLLTREELFAYIQTALCVDVARITSVVAHCDRSTMPGDGVERVPYHRYELCIENGSVLHMAPTEGMLRIDHLAFQTQCLAVLLGREVGFAIVGDYDITQKAKNVVASIKKELHDGELIQGIVVGSLWNFNFFVNRRLHRDALNAIIASTQSEPADDYLLFRARQCAVEQLVLDGAIVLTDAEGATFREGALPDTADKELLEGIMARADSQLFNAMVEQMLADEALRDYMALDYLFFKDLRDGTTLFNQTTDFPETVIKENKELAFQLLRIEGKTFVNFGWFNAALLAEVTKQLQKIYPISTLHMYGKCGSISQLSAGSLVLPTCTAMAAGKVLQIDNALTGLPRGSFSCVESPLVETHTWARAMQARGDVCVEMELYPLLSVLDKSVRPAIVYYASDQPLKDVKISHRLAYLRQKVACVELLLDDMFS